MSDSMLDYESLGSPTESSCSLLCVLSAELSRHLELFVTNPLKVWTNKVKDRWPTMLSPVAGQNAVDERRRN